MANEIGPVRATTGSTVYVVIFKDGSVYGNAADSFATFADASWSDYVVSLTESGSSGLFFADLPTNVSQVNTNIYVAYERIGASAAITDRYLGQGIIGTPLTLSAIRSVGPVQATSGLTLYFQVWSKGNVHDQTTGTFGTFADASVANYDYPMTEAGTASGLYTGTFPTSLSNLNDYEVLVYERAGATPALSDALLGTYILKTDNTLRIQST